MILDDLIALGIAFLVILGLVIIALVAYRRRQRALHPPPSQGEIISGLEDNLRTIDKEIEDTWE